ERLHARAERLALRRLGGDALNIDERVFRASRKRRLRGGLLGGRCRRRRRSGGVGEAWGGSQYDAERRGNDKSSHYTQSFPVVRKLKILARGKYRADVEGAALPLRSAFPSPGIFLKVVDQQFVRGRSGHKPDVVHANAQV